MIEVRTVEQLARAIRQVRADHARGMGTMDLIRSLKIDPLTELRGGDWRGTNFAACDLRNADLTECRFAFCDFTNADVAGAVFYGSDLFSSTLHRALNITLAYFDDSQLRHLDECRGRDAAGEGSVFHINQKIRAATSFELAKAQFVSILERGMRPDSYSGGLLIGQAGNPRQAWEAFEMVEAAACEANEIVFTVLSSRMRSTEDVRAVMDIMRRNGVAPGSRVYNTLLSRTRDDGDLRAIVEEMHREAVVPDNVTYDILMRRAPFAGRKALLDHLLREGLHAGTQELNILLRGARSEEQADEAIEIANELEIRRDAETYALLAPHKARPSAFRTLIEDMIEDDLGRDTNFYNLAISRTSSFEEGCFLFGRMARDKVAPGARIYERLAWLGGARREFLDPDEPDAPERAIAALVRRIGTPADIRAAGLDNGPHATTG
jgi:hypothetical protein